MFLACALENVYDLVKSFLCHNVLHSDSNKAPKELNQNVNWKRFRITVAYLGAIQRQILKLTCSLIGVLCVYFIIEMFKDLVITV